MTFVISAFQMCVLHFGHFFENRNNSGLIPGQNDDPVTRTWKMTQMTHWPGDPMTQFHVWSAAGRRRHGRGHAGPTPTRTTTGRCRPAQTRRLCRTPSRTARMWTRCSRTRQSPRSPWNFRFPTPSRWRTFRPSCKGGKPKRHGVVDEYLKYHKKRSSSYLDKINLLKPAYSKNTDACEMIWLKFLKITITYTIQQYHLILFFQRKS